MNESLSTPKLLGGIGAILLILNITPYLGNLPSLAGVVLMLISFNMFSKIFNEPQIFKNALISFILAVVGGLIAFFTVFTVNPTSIAEFRWAPPAIF